LYAAGTYEKYKLFLILGFVLLVGPMLGTRYWVPGTRYWYKLFCAVLVGHSTGRDNNKTSNQPSAIAMAISAAIDTQQPCELLPLQDDCSSRCIGDENCYSQSARRESPRLQQQPPANSNGGGGLQAAMRQQSGGGSPGAKKQPWNQVAAMVEVEAVEAAAMAAAVEAAAATVAAEVAAEVAAVVAAAMTAAATMAAGMTAAATMAAAVMAAAATAAAIAAVAVGAAAARQQQ